MLVHLQKPRPVAKYNITFTKGELNRILALYSYQVAKGQWRDYAIDFLKQMAIFSIFRHAHEQPLISILKIPANTAQGYVYELIVEKKRLSRSAELDLALEPLRKTLK
ncbi:MAG: hypothetical protein JWM96_543 [Alphaproteobacteria bacterium]|nr:hypothetical protein [Alphaproteobacteria bacterium]